MNKSTLYVFLFQLLATPNRILVGILLLSAFSVASGKTVTSITDSRALMRPLLLSPGPLVLDTSGNLYTFDERERAAFKISPRGSIEVIVDFELAGLGYPIAVAIDSNDNVYYLSSRFLSRFDQAGELLTIDLRTYLGTDYFPFYQMTIDSGDAIYLGRENRLRDGPDLLRLQLDGSHEAIDVGDYQASARIGDMIPRPTGGVYLAANGSVFAVDSQGSVTEVIGPADYPQQSVALPDTLALDRMGNIYFSLGSQVFRHAGDQIVSIASTEDWIQDLIVDDAGNVYIMHVFRGGFGSRVLNTITRVSAQGESTEIQPLQSTDKISNISTLSASFAPSEHGPIIFSFGQLGIVTIDEAAAISLITDVLPAGGTPRFSGQIAMDFAGNSYYSDGSVVTRLTPEGHRNELIPHYGDGDNALRDIGALVVDLHGAVYAAGETSHNVLWADAAGNVRQLIASAGDGTSPLQTPSSIVVSPIDQSVFVAGRDSNNVFRIDTEGNVTQIIDQSGDGLAPMLQPEALAIDRQGKLFVVAYATNNVFTIDGNGTVEEILNSTGDGRNGLTDPIAITIAADGAAYVAGEASNNLMVVRPNGNIEQVLDSSGDGTHPFIGPHSLASDAFGNIFVTGLRSHNAFALTDAGPVMFFDVHDYTEVAYEHPRAGDIALDGRGTLLLHAHTGLVISAPVLYRIDYPEQISTAFNSQTGELLTAVTIPGEGLFDVSFKLFPSIDPAPIFEFDSISYRQHGLHESARYDVTTQVLSAPQVSVIGDRIYRDLRLQRLSSESLLFRLTDIRE